MVCFLTGLVIIGTNHLLRNVKKAIILYVTYKKSKTFEKDKIRNRRKLTLCGFIIRSLI